MTKQECYTFASKCWRDTHDFNCNGDLLKIFTEAVNRMDYEDIKFTKEYDKLEDYAADLRNEVVTNREDEFTVIKNYCCARDFLQYYGGIDAEEGLKCFYNENFDRDLIHMAESYLNKFKENKKDLEMEEI